MTATFNRLHVAPKLTETTPGEYVLDGYTISPILADQEMPSEPLYQSRSALKATVKAMVLTADERFLGYAVTYGEGVAEQAGKENLIQIATVGKYNALGAPLAAALAIVNAEVPVDAIVDHIKKKGNNADGPNTEGTGL